MAIPAANGSVMHRGLIVAWPFSRLLMNGTKTAELRRYDLSHRNFVNADETLWLIETRGYRTTNARRHATFDDNVLIDAFTETCILGTIQFRSSTPISSRCAFDRMLHAHRVRPGSKFGWKADAPLYAWWVECVAPLQEPVKVNDAFKLAYVTVPNVSIQRGDAGPVVSQLRAVRGPARTKCHTASQGDAKQSFCGSFNKSCQHRGGLLVHDHDSIGLPSLPEWQKTFELTPVHGSVESTQPRTPIPSGAKRKYCDAFKPSDRHKAEFPSDKRDTSQLICPTNSQESTTVYVGSEPPSPTVRGSLRTESRTTSPSGSKQSLCGEYKKNCHHRAGVHVDAHASSGLHPLPDSQETLVPTPEDVNVEIAQHPTPFQSGAKRKYCDAVTPSDRHIAEPPSSNRDTSYLFYPTYSLETTVPTQSDVHDGSEPPSPMPRGLSAPTFCRSFEQSELHVGTEPPSSMPRGSAAPTFCQSFGHSDKHIRRRGTGRRLT